MIPSRQTLQRVSIPLTLGLICFNALLAWVNLTRTKTAIVRLERAQLVVQIASEILSEAREAESSQRGYLITGREDYLKPYLKAKERIPGLLQQLEPLSDRAPSQRTYLKTLDQLIKQRGAELAEGIVARRDHGGREANAVVRSGEGQRIMEQINATIKAMVDDERRGFRQLTQEGSLAYLQILNSVLIATVAALWALWLARKYRRGELHQAVAKDEASAMGRARLGAAILGLDTAVISTDALGRVEMMNPAAEILIGYPLKETAGRSVSEFLRLVNMATGSSVENSVARAVRSGVVRELPKETLLVSRDRSRHLVEDSLSVVRGPAGQTIGLVLVLRDLTASRKAEAERERILAGERAALARAEEAIRAKDKFLAILSHELRTPLNPIMLAVTSMLARTNVTPEEIRPTMEMIRDNVALESRLIDDLLDIMRITRGKLTLKQAIVDAHALLHHALQVCQNDLEKKGLGLVIDLAATDTYVLADPVRLEQVFWNLLKNAIKFTPTGGTIEVRTRLEAKVKEGEQSLVIEFVDTGIGIEREVLAQVFEPFQQADQSITRRFGGLGLGLAISRGILDAHDASLTAESPGRDHGTLFRIRLKSEPTPVIEAPEVPKQSTQTPHPPQALPDRPARAAQPPALKPGAPSPLLRIFLIEDEPTTLMVIARLLRRLGHNVTTAGSIQEAIMASDGVEFDVIISDIGLPDGSGHDLIRLLLTKWNVPSIALTGFGMQDDIRMSREAGFDIHLTKPIDFAKLLATIREVTAHMPI